MSHDNLLRNCDAQILRFITREKKDQKKSFNSLAKIRFQNTVSFHYNSRRIKRS